MKNLQHLDLRENDPNAMMFPPSLEFLALDDGSGVAYWMSPPYSVSKANGLMLPNLKSLMCRSIHDAAILLWTSSENPPRDCVFTGESRGIGSKLETLHIEFPGITPATEMTRLGHFDRLEEVVDLSLRAASTVDDVWAPWIAAHGHRLRKINLDDSDITGYGLKKIIEAAPQMRSVNVRRCLALSDDASHWVTAKGIRIDNLLGVDKTGGRRVRY